MNKLLVAMLASTSLACFTGCVEPDDTTETAQALELPPDTACYGEGNFVGVKAPPYQEWTGAAPASTPKDVWIIVDLDETTSAVFLVDVDNAMVPFAGRFPRVKTGQVITYIAGVHGQLGHVRGGPGTVGPRGTDPQPKYDEQKNEYEFMGQFVLETGMRIRAAATQGAQAVR